MASFPGIYSQHTKMRFCSKTHAEIRVLEIKSKTKPPLQTRCELALRITLSVALTPEAAEAAVLLQQESEHLQREIRGFHPSCGYPQPKPGPVRANGKAMLLLCLSFTLISSNCVFPPASEFFLFLVRLFFETSMSPYGKMLLRNVIQACQGIHKAK